ncbi:Co-chaperone HscB, C-terminal oligomerization domain-containing protein [Clohesyomyces aquaticus]|uniref:Co-chaperone HscB, C-terminal oligomerization domain-containing protein n=1 Tax=Clohesyomyces aquaticus TaxID=1231657 RepID=A0A1Y1YQZ0_9PLEO|nr:Co-chaperone HscB, C-terminal oligomerization domain-containing protein [Clohesyomyces aquaticus]
MRPASPAAISWLRASLSSETSASSLRAPRRPATCLFHASRPSSSLSSRRHQSTNHARPEEVDTSLKSHTHYHFFPQSLPAGPPPHGRFAINLSSLKKEFLQLQARAHPDLHPPERKNKAQALSARINEAYKTLQSPLLRAQYLLSLKGIDVHEDESAKVEDPELLMEVLETRERIEEAKREEELRELREENDGRIERSVDVLEKAFERDDVEVAKSEAVRLKYWVNVKESLDGWERGKPVVLEH